MVLLAGQRKYPGKIFYQAFFRSPAADQILQADVRSTLLRGLYTLSGDASSEERWRPVTGAGSFAPPAPLKQPPWITEHDLDFLDEEFQALERNVIERGRERPGEVNRLLIDFLQCVTAESLRCGEDPQLRR